MIGSSYSNYPRFGMNSPSRPSSAMSNYSKNILERIPVEDLVKLGGLEHALNTVNTERWYGRVPDNVNHYETETIKKEALPRVIAYKRQLDQQIEQQYAPSPDYPQEQQPSQQVSWTVAWHSQHGQLPPSNKLFDPNVPTPPQSVSSHPGGVIRSQRGYATSSPHPYASTPSRASGLGITEPKLKADGTPYKNRPGAGRPLKYIVASGSGYNGRLNAHEQDAKDAYSRNEPYTDRKGLEHKLSNDPTRPRSPFYSAKFRRLGDYYIAEPDGQGSFIYGPNPSPKARKSSKKK